MLKSRHIIRGFFITYLLLVISETIISFKNKIGGRNGYHVPISASYLSPTLPLERHFPP